MPTPKPLDLSYGHIVSIAAPVLIANLAMPLQGAIDVSVVGHFPQSYNLAGLGIATQLWALILVSFNFLQYASSGLSAQAVGKLAVNQNSPFELSDILVRSLTLAFILAIFLWTAKSQVIDIGLQILGAQPNSRHAAQTYLDIRYFGLIFELMNYAFIGWFAGQGKTNLMMLVQLVISLVNIGLTLFFVYSLNLGLQGVALGTVLGYALGCLIASMLAYQKVLRPLFINPSILNNISFFTFINNLKSRYKEIFSLDKMTSLFSLNKDIFIRTLVLTLGFAWITRLSAQQGDIIMATNAVLLQVLSISSFALDGVAVAAESLSGQAYSRKVQQQFYLAVKRTGVVIFSLASTLSLIWYFIMPNFLLLMTNITEVYELAYQYRHVAALLPLIGAGAYWLDGIMFGLTDGKKIRKVALIVATVFFPLTWYINHLYSDSYAMPVIWFCVYCLLLSRFIIATLILWKHRYTLI